MIRLVDVMKNSKQSGTFLQSRFIYSSGPNILLVLLGLLFITLVILVSNWDSFIYLIIAGGVLAFIFARQFQKLNRWIKLGRDAVFFDPLYFYSVKQFEIQIIPLIDYLDSDISLSADKHNYLARFHFKSCTILLICSSLKDHKFLNFRESITNYIRLIKRSPESSKTPREFDLTFQDKLNANQNPLLITAFSIIVLFFTLQIIIDSNLYKIAIGINTPTGFRSYLKEERNLRHRDEARFKIKEIYNYYISQYSEKAGTSLGASSFKQVLEYHRDKDLYNLKLIFTSKSEVANISTSGYNVVSITQSFSPEKNISRQNEVLNALNSSLGTIFPNDIVTLASESIDELPRLQVYYTYINKDNSLYYSEKEENVAEYLRTWYYGIEIDWYFSLFVPPKETPIFRFNLVSQPAPRFTSESFSADAVYNNMAFSAFNDFKSEFQRQFFIGE